MAIKVKAILRRALQVINAVEIGTEPTADEYALALEFFNDLLTGQDGQKLFYFSREEFSTVAGQVEYTIGSGGNFDTARPVRINSAQIKDPSSNTEWDVYVIPQNIYDNHALKNTQARPYQLFYNPEYPLGKIRLFFVPEKIYTLRLNLMKELVEYDSINDDFALPNPYRRMMTFKLAEECADAWGFPVPNGVARIARQAEKVVRRINLANNIEDAELDRTLQVMPGRGGNRREFFYGG
jgi:hypothetical protein